MLLTADIGNSYITLGGYREKELVFISELVTDVYRTVDQYAVELLSIMQLNGVDVEEISGAIISSVVPELTDTIQNTIKKLMGVTALIVGPGVKSGLKIQIENPAQLGADLVACAVAALDQFKPPIIICDLGTATVMSVIDENSNFCGVIIAAGVGTTQDVFTTRTALLPHVRIEQPKTLIGKNTTSSIQSGLVNGTASMIDGLALRIERELDCEAQIVATGRLSETVIPYCDRNIAVCKNLLLDGLRIIYEKNQKPSI